MSSVLRRPAQIAPRTAYFLVTDSTPVTTDVLTASFLDLSGAATTLAGLNTFVTTAVAAGTNSPLKVNSSITGGLLKDLGQEIILVDADGNHYARYRNALIINGSGSEGIATVAADNVLVRVWAADGTGVAVARTG